jgi:hypothetical protein
MVSLRRSSAAISRSIALARSAGAVRGHGPSSKARRAARMARSISALVPFGACATTSSVAGLMTSNVPPPASDHLPSM